jgi:SAM-dependent methyltransferase
MVYTNTQVTVTDGYNIDFFDVLRKVEENHWWFRARARAITAILGKYASVPESYLEIGCGTGYMLQAMTKAFPETKLHGDELFEEGLRHARDRLPSVSLRKKDACLLDDETAYDCIGAFDVLEHIEEDERVLANIARALKPEGYLIATVPQHMALWSKLDEYAHHARRYARAELPRKVIQAGLIPVYVGSFVSLLFPAMWLSRKMKGPQKQVDPLSELHCSRVNNFLLGRVMAIEYLLLQAGVRFPFGGSQLLLARKA